MYLNVQIFSLVFLINKYNMKVFEALTNLNTNQSCNKTCQNLTFIKECKGRAKARTHVKPQYNIAYFAVKNLFF